MLLHKPSYLGSWFLDSFVCMRVLSAYNMMDQLPFAVANGVSRLCGLLVGHMSNCTALLVAEAMLFVVVSFIYTASVECLCCLMYTWKQN